MALRKENPIQLGVKLEGIRRQLLEQRETLHHGLRVATAEFLNDESLYTDAIDQASADVDKSFAMQLKSRDRDTLIQIDSALRRIEAGEFGSCERCEDEISEARIKAFPFTTLCIDCKAELESEEHRFPGRNASN
jgi:DnaK suppressor protein